MNNLSLNAFVMSTLNEGFIEMKLLNGGANNQGYKVETSLGNNYFLKCFPPDNDTSKQKLYNEFQFAKAIFDAGVTDVPKPVTYSFELFCALYQFIDGKKIKQLGDIHILQALEFVVNTNSKSIDLKKIADASESPNDLYGFLDIIDKRLVKFRSVRAEKQYKSKLFSLLQQIEEDRNNIEKSVDIKWQKLIHKSLLSASDFGFHNAIATTNKLYFIDFEYAGKDSSWKLFCDFYSQPANPVPIRTAYIFLQHPMFRELIDEPDVLLAVYQLTLLKWCLIMLNEFLPDVQRRRIFSWSITDTNIRQKKLLSIQKNQLNKSFDYYCDISNKISQLKNVLKDKNK